MQPLLEMTQHEFAELCGVNRESIRLWTLEGMPGVSKANAQSLTDETGTTNKQNLHAIFSMAFGEAK